MHTKPSRPKFTTDFKGKLMYFKTSNKFKMRNVADKNTVR
jgi:hypothetical protein